jgi:hypothetical protein
MPLFGDFEIPKHKDFDDGATGQIRIGGSKAGVAYTTDTLRITADDEATLETLAKAHGGEVAEWETNKSDRFELLTTIKAVVVDLFSWNAGFERWHEKKLVVQCDGKEQRDGSPCECPASISERKELAKVGKACKPKFKAQVCFPDSPELGKFRFESGAWSLVNKSNDIEQHVADGPAPIEIAIGDFTNNKGQLVRFPKVSIKDPVKS